MAKPYEKIDSITTQSDLAEFVFELAEDFRQNPESWENNDLGLFLEALGAWIESMDGYYLNNGLPVPEKPDWKNVADMLWAATMQE